MFLYKYRYFIFIFNTMNALYNPNLIFHHELNDTFHIITKPIL